MPNTPKKLYVGQPATTITTLYTVPASTTTIAKNIILANTTATDATIDVHFVPNAGAAGATNKIIPTYTVPTNDSIVVDMAGVLETGDTIQALQATASAITVYISGVEVA